MNSAIIRPWSGQLVSIANVSPLRHENAFRSIGPGRRTISAMRFQSLGGRESGTEKLEEAVAAYRAALEEYTRERVPLQWAMTQMNLGTALLRLGGRESGTEKLEEAVAAYRAALEEYTRERVPLDWAGTQNNLALRFRVSGSGRAELRSSKRRSRPIAPRWRNIRASAFRSNGR